MGVFTRGRLGEGGEGELAREVVHIGCAGADSVESRISVSVTWRASDQNRMQKCTIGQRYRSPRVPVVYTLLHQIRAAGRSDS